MSYKMSASCLLFGRVGQAFRCFTVFGVNGTNQFSHINRQIVFSFD